MATLTVSLQNCSERVEWPVEVTTFEDHTTEQRNLRSTTAKRVWTCQTPMLTLSQMQTIQSFHAARYGSFESFTWVSPLDGQSHTVKFQQGAFQINPDQGSTRFSVAFTLESVTD
jgi:hypothetical protein